MPTEYILSAIAILGAAIAIVISYYQYIRKRIEEEALDAINKSEDTDLIGEQKLQNAVEIVYALLPVIAKPFISEKLIEMVIQQVFDKVEEYAQKQIDKKHSESDDASENVTVEEDPVETPDPIETPDPVETPDVTETSEA